MTLPSISAVKVSYQYQRWEVAIVWEGLPFALRVGTGDSPEAAFKQAAEQLVHDVAKYKSEEPKDVLDARKMVRPGDEPLA